jgi:hypothetical protein
MRASGDECRSSHHCDLDARDTVPLPTPTVLSASLTLSPAVSRMRMATSTFASVHRHALPDKPTSGRWGQVPIARCFLNVREIALHGGEEASQLRPYGCQAFHRANSHDHDPQWLYSPPACAKIGSAKGRLSSQEKCQPFTGSSALTLRLQHPGQLHRSLPRPHQSVGVAIELFHPIL